MRASIFIGLAACWIAWSTGCAHLTSGAGEVNAAAFALDSYMPLAVGDRWTYATSFQGQPQADLTVRIVKREGPVFLDNRPQPARYRYDSEGLRDGNRRYLLKAPLVVGTEWLSVADLNTVEHYRIVDVDRKVRVPAGVFEHCVAVQMEVRMSETRVLRNVMTFAPDVGIVEIRTLLKDGARFLPQSLLQLKSYELASPQS